MTGTKLLLWLLKQKIKKKKNAQKTEFQLIGTL